MFLHVLIYPLFFQIFSSLIFIFLILFPEKRQELPASPFIHKIEAKMKVKLLIFSPYHHILVFNFVFKYPFGKFWSSLCRYKPGLSCWQLCRIKNEFEGHGRRFYLYHVRNMSKPDVCIYIQFPMKLTSALLLATLVLAAAAIPFRDQIALMNSLEVGRDESPMTWACTGCDDDNKPITSTIIQEKVVEVKAILSVYSEYSVLAFRYTNNLKNIEQDIAWGIQKQDEHAPSGCKVQKAMDNMWNKIRKETVEQLVTLPHTRHLIITGISLGGALSVLSWVDISRENIFDQIEIVTFGAPRVGNKNWAKWFNTQTRSIRYTLSEDPIPILPRCLTLLCNYGHTGNKIQCRKNSKTCHCMDDDDDSSFNFLQTASALSKAALEHYREDEHESQGYSIGILDHINEYKNVKTYTQVC